VIPTGPDGASGPLVRVDAAGRSEASLAGAIALVDLPFARWSTATAKPVKEPIAAAFEASCRAWEVEPAHFTSNPHHQIPGPNI
jgi:hypothetical protein